jgi:hypothetical protein
MKACGNGHGWNLAKQEKALEESQIKRLKVIEMLAIQGKH